MGRLGEPGGEKCAGAARRGGGVEVVGMVARDNSSCCHGSWEEVKAGRMESVLYMLVLLVRVAETKSWWCSSEKLPCVPAVGCRVFPLLLLGLLAGQV